EYAAKFAKEQGAGRVTDSEVEEWARWALAPFERTAGDEGPYKVQQDLQVMMQDLVGIVRKENEMQRALDGLGKLWERARRVRVVGNREYNPGWHTALDLDNLLTVSEAITRASLERKESRGAQFREDYPDKEDAFGKVNTMISKADDGSMKVRLEPLPEMPDYLKRVVEDNR